MNTFLFSFLSDHVKGQKHILKVISLVGFGKTNKKISVEKTLQKLSQCGNSVCSVHENSVEKDVLGNTFK